MRGSILIGGPVPLSGYAPMVVGTQQRGAGRPWPPWIFIHSTNIIDGGLIVPFLVSFCYFAVFFPLPLPTS